MDSQDQNQQEQAGSNDLKSETDLAEGGTETGEKQGDGRPSEIEGQNDGLPETTSKDTVEEVVQDIDNESESQSIEVGGIKEEKSDEQTEGVENRGEEQVGSDASLNQEGETVAASESQSDKQIEAQNDTTNEKESEEPVAATELVSEDDCNEAKNGVIATTENTTGEGHEELNQPPEGSEVKQTNEDDPEASGISEGNMNAKEDNQEQEEPTAAQITQQASASIANERQLTDDKPQEDQPSASIPDDVESQRVRQDEEMQPVKDEGGKAERQEQEFQDKSNDIAESSGLESEESQGNGVPSLPDDTISADVQAEDEEICKLEPEQQNKDFHAGDTNQALPELSPTMMEEEKVSVEQASESFSEPLKQHEKSEIYKDDVVQTGELDSEDHAVSGQEHVLPSSEETTSEGNTIKEVSQTKVSETDETEYDEGHSQSEEHLGPEDRHSPSEDIDRKETTITDDQSIVQTESTMTEQAKAIESPEEPGESRKDILTEPKVMSQEEQATSQESIGDVFSSQAELQDDQEQVCQPLEAESLATSPSDVQDNENNLVADQKLPIAEVLGVEEKENDTEATNLPTPKETEAEVAGLIAAPQDAAPLAVDVEEPHKERQREGVGKNVITETEETRSIEEQAVVPDVVPKASESEQPYKDTQPDEESRDDVNQGKKFIPTDEEEALSESPHDMSSPLLGASPTEKKSIFQEDSESIRPGGAAVIPSTAEFEQPEASVQDEKAPLVKKSKDGGKTYGTSDKDDVEQTKPAPSGLFARIRTLVHAYCNIL